MQSQVETIKNKHNRQMDRYSIWASLRPTALKRSNLKQPSSGAAPASGPPPSPPRLRLSSLQSDLCILKKRKKKVPLGSIITVQIRIKRALTSGRPWRERDGKSAQVSKWEGNGSMKYLRKSVKAHSQTAVGLGSSHPFQEFRSALEWNSQIRISMAMLHKEANGKGTKDFAVVWNVLNMPYFVVSLKLIRI